MRIRKFRFAGILMIVAAIIANSHIHGQEEGKRFTPTFSPFFWGQAQMVNDETDGESSTFDFKRARFGAKGKLHENISYHLMIEGLLKNPDGSERVTFLQGWAQYHISPLAEIKIGQFKYPFGYEVYPSFTTWKFINPSAVTANVVKELGRKSAGSASGYFRDIGAQLGGVYKFNRNYSLEYKTMIFNGNGINKNDDNDQKDFVLNGVFKLPAGISISGSYYSGKFEQANGSAKVKLDESALGIVFRWNNTLMNKPFQIQSEFISATYESNDSDVLPQGFYVYGAYFVTPHIEIGVRYDEYEPNKNAAVTFKQEQTTLAASYYIQERQRISLNYEIKDGVGFDPHNILTAQFQLAFN